MDWSNRIDVCNFRADMANKAAFRISQVCKGETKEIEEAYKLAKEYATPYVKLLLNNMEQDGIETENYGEVLSLAQDLVLIGGPDALTNIPEMQSLLISYASKGVSIPD